MDSGAPQLLVNFNADLSEKLRVMTTPVPTVGLGVGMGRDYYSYRGGLYSAWLLYRDETTVSPYQEGTLNIDVVDAAVAAAFAKYPIPGPAKAK